MIRGVKTLWLQRSLVQHYGRRHVRDSRNSSPLPPPSAPLQPSSAPLQPSSAPLQPSSALAPLQLLSVTEDGISSVTQNGRDDSRDFFPLPPPSTPLPPSSAPLPPSPSSAPLPPSPSSALRKALPSVTKDGTIRQLNKKDFLDVLASDINLAKTCTDKKALQEEYKKIRSDIVYRGLSSPFSRNQIGTRHLAAASKRVFGEAPVVINAYHVSLNSKRLCKDASAKMLDFFCSEHAVVTPDWNEWPPVTVCVDYYEKGPSFPHQNIKFLRGECDGSYKDNVGAIALIIWDGLNIKWCEICKDVNAITSTEAECKAMFVLFKRGLNLAEYMEVRCDLEFVASALRGHTIVDPAHAQFDLLSAIQFLKSYFTIVAVRRVPREGLLFVDQLMRIKNVSRFTVPLLEWTPYLSGYPIFTFHGKFKHVKTLRNYVQMRELICYAEATEDKRLYALKHMMHALGSVSSLQVVAADVDSIVVPMAQLFKNENASWEKLGDNVIEFQFGRSKQHERLLVVFDVGLQNVICTDRFALTILVPLPHETLYLRSIPEFSVRSKLSFKGQPYTPPRLGEEIAIENGLSKTLLKEGDGLESPNDGDEVEVLYSISHDGEILRSSSDLDGPYVTTIGTDHLAAWNMAIKSMTRGEKAVFEISHMVAYGEAGLPPSIPPKASLLMEVELVSWAPIYYICEDEGIILKVVKPGYTWQTPKDSDLVTVTYEVSLKDGTVVSKSCGAEFILSEGIFCGAIAKSLKMMRQEEKALVVVKPEHGFGKTGRPSIGEEGAIPPNATLYIKLELHSWRTSDNKVQTCPEV